MDLHQALNWRAIWRVLREVPSNSPISLLDAGCGDGSWCRRIAGLRPSWQVYGVDADPRRLAQARAIALEPTVPSVTYIDADFSERVPGRYDVIVSVASIHYAASDGRGIDVLRCLRGALTEGGLLILLVPRKQEEQPVWSKLPRPKGWPVFRVEELESMLTEAGLYVREIQGLYGPWCVLGKQVSMLGGNSRAVRLALAPLVALVRAFTPDLIREPHKASYALRAMAVAR